MSDEYEMTGPSGKKGPGLWTIVSLVVVAIGLISIFVFQPWEHLRADGELITNDVAGVDTGDDDAVEDPTEANDPEIVVNSGGLDEVVVEQALVPSELMMFVNTMHVYNTSWHDLAVEMVTPEVIRAEVDRRWPNVQSLSDDLSNESAAVVLFELALLAEKSEHGQAAEINQAAVEAMNVQGLELAFAVPLEGHPNGVYLALLEGSKTRIEALAQAAPAENDPPDAG